MTRDLNDLMHENVAARERAIAGIEPTAAALATTVRQVRRRRAVRRTLQVGGAGAAAVVLGAAALLGLRGHETPLPAHTPTPSVSGSPTASPTPTPTPTTPALETVPGLPPTRALPPGLLERTTPGWVLTLYRSQPAGDDGAPAVHTVVLVSPAGERYRVVDLPVDPPVHLLRWDAGSTTAVVTIPSTDGSGYGGVPRVELDLATGTLTPTPVDLFEYGGGPFYEGLTADGAELWTTATSTDAATSELFRRTDDGALVSVGGIGIGMLLDPTRTRAVTDAYPDEGFAVLDVMEGGRTNLDFGVPEKRCEVVSWVDASSLLALCAQRTLEGVAFTYADAALYRVDVEGSATRATEVAQFADDDAMPDMWNGVGLGDGRAAFPMVGRGASTCPVGVMTWDGEALTSLVDGPGTGWRVGALDDVVHVETGRCDELAPTELTAHDLVSGTSVLLAPAPDPAAEVPAWARGLADWVVGQARVVDR